MLCAGDYGSFRYQPLKEDFPYLTLQSYYTSLASFTFILKRVMEHFYFKKLIFNWKLSSLQMFKLRGKSLDITLKICKGLHIFIFCDFYSGCAKMFGYH